MRAQPSSLQLRLALGLAGVFVLAALALGAGVYLEARSVARSFEAWSPEGPGGEGFAHAVLAEFVTDVAWLIPIVAGATLGVAALTLRRALRPLREASARASEVGGARPHVRLPLRGLPSELRPLVDAVNHALDRLEATLEQQRRFTADAAHQLRTPLAVLTAGLDALPPGEAAAALRCDVVRMNRLVDQLLAVARLESVELDVSGTVDLSALAAETVAALAPLALREGREVALLGAEEPARVRGNAAALGDALRNLAENALAHSPPGARVDVVVEPEGALRVEDRGPGIPPELRERVFERFWRGAGRRGSGAGLGLAIVEEIALAHGGRVEVAERPGGGSVFRLVLSAGTGAPDGA